MPKIPAVARSMSSSRAQCRAGGFGSITVATWPPQSEPKEGGIGEIDMNSPSEESRIIPPKSTRSIRNGPKVQESVKYAAAVGLLGPDRARPPQPPPSRLIPSPARREPAELAAAWTAEHLVAIWSSLPAVTPVERFNSSYGAASCIWARIQGLGEAATPNARGRTSPHPFRP